MFFGDNVGNTIHRLTHTEKYNILYRPHGTCYDHFIRHLVYDYTDKFFISNRVIVDKAINLLDSYSLEQLLETRLCVPYNFQMCSNVNKNLEATFANHLPLIYMVHTKEDLIDISNNVLGLYPYIILIANRALYDIAVKLDVDRNRLFYSPFCVQNNLSEKIDRNLEKTVDVAIFLGGQEIEQVESIANKLNSYNISVHICPNNFSSQALINVFQNSKMVVELNPHNIYNIIYAINCGVPAIIYNKEHTGNQDYIYRNFEEMIEKVKKFINNNEPLPSIGFIDQDATNISTILTNINNRGLIL